MTGMKALRSAILFFVLSSLERLNDTNMHESYKSTKPVLIYTVFMLLYTTALLKPQCQSWVNPGFSKTSLSLVFGHSFMPSYTFSLTS